VLSLSAASPACSVCVITAAGGAPLRSVENAAAPRHPQRPRLSSGVYGLAVHLSAL